MTRPTKPILDLVRIDGVYQLPPKGRQAKGEWQHFSIFEDPTIPPGSFYMGVDPARGRDRTGFFFTHARRTAAGLHAEMERKIKAQLDAYLKEHFGL